MKAEVSKKQSYQQSRVGLKSVSNFLEDADKNEINEFKEFTSPQLRNFIRENWGKKLSSQDAIIQVDRVLVDVSDQTFFTKRPLSRTFVLAVFLVFGSSLISGTSYAGNRAQFYVNSVYSKFQQLIPESAHIKPLTVMDGDQKFVPLNLEI